MKRASHRRGLKPKAQDPSGEMWTHTPEGLLPRGWAKAQWPATPGPSSSPAPAYYI